MTGSSATRSISAQAGQELSSDGEFRPLHVVITSPFVWPWVRRGSERMLNDLSRYLTDRGHRVTVFSTGPNDRVEDRDGIEYHLLRQRFGTRPRQFNSLHDFAFRLQHALGRLDPDVVFSMHYFDAYAAIRARQRNRARYPVIFHSVGILSRRHFRAVPLDAWLFRLVRREADLTLAVSRYAGQVYRREFGVDAVVLPPPVIVEQFQPEGAVSAPQAGSAPRILFVGDADERRKGARVLCRSFARIVQRDARAELLFAGHAGEATRRALIGECGDAAGQVRFLGVGRVEDLPELYRSASVTVLPAIGESFGMVLVESLASGTPVVACRHGGSTEIIDDERVGRLFEPGEIADQTENVDGLTEAILDVLARGKTPQIVAACRTRAQRYSFSVLGPVYERLLQTLASAGSGASRATGQSR